MQLKEIKNKFFMQNVETSQDISYIFAIGEIDGNLMAAYAAVLEKEKQTGVCADWIITPGSTGIWPNSNSVDRATRSRGGNKEFEELLKNNWAAPRNTLFISGAHEDHRWLDQRVLTENTQILGNFWYLPNSCCASIGPSITGLGKVYSPKVYKDKKRNKALKYYTRNEVEKACSTGPVDMVLSHQGPSNTAFGKKVSNSEGIKPILFASRPKFLVHSGYDFSMAYNCMDTVCLSLAKMEIIIFKWDQMSKKLSLFYSNLR